MQRPRLVMEGALQRSPTILRQSEQQEDKHKQCLTTLCQFWTSRYKRSHRTSSESQPPSWRSWRPLGKFKHEQSRLLDRHSLKAAELGTVWKRHHGFMDLIKACGRQKDLHKCSRIHADILKTGLLKSNVYIGTALVQMYAKCGALEKAQGVFDELPTQNVVTWNVLITGYVQHGLGEEALKCFGQMCAEGFSPDAVTFICILKACGSIRAIQKGEEIHAEICNLGLLGSGDIALSNALVNMYAKCGALAKAQQVFDGFPIHDVVSWNALIAGYAQHGLGEDALACFGQMQNEGFPPNAITYTCTLKACGSIGAIKKGEEIHAEVCRLGLLKNQDIVLGNALINMYAKCGVLAKAQEVFDGLPLKDAISWNVIIAGYVQHGLGLEALNCFGQMRDEGLSPDVITFICILKACASIGAIKKGKEIHDEVYRLGLLENGETELGNALVDMYAKCGMPSKAQEVFDGLLERNLISWNTLIDGYAQHGLGEEAVSCFSQMRDEGFSPNIVTFGSLLKACGSMRAIEKGEEIYAEVRRLGLLQNYEIVLGNALVNMYMRCGALAKAQEIFDGLLMRDASSWNVMIAGYAQHGLCEGALNSFWQMQIEGFFPDAVTLICILKACGSIGAIEKGKEIHCMVHRLGLLEHHELVLGNALVDMYARCGVPAKAQKVFDGLLVRDAVSWTSLIAGYAQHGPVEEALTCFEQMKNDGFSPDTVTFVCILKACSSLGAMEKGEEIHAEVHRLGLLEYHDIVLGTALVDMYAKFGALVKAQQVFDGLPIRNAISWNVLIAGYAKHGFGEEALNCFRRMQDEGFSPRAVTFVCILKACGSIGAIEKGEEIHDKVYRLGLLETHGIVLGNALLDMYVKCGMLAKAQEVFDGLPVRDAVSWTVLISGYAQHGLGEKALNCFARMQDEGFSPDVVTFVCILKACGSIGATEEGEEIYAAVCRLGLLENHAIVLGTALVDMFAKCSALAKAQEVFDGLPARNAVSWNTLMAGYARLGKAERVFNLFSKMTQESIEPDGVTFAILLTACSHAGLVEEGQIYFNMMNTVYCLIPSSEHHTYLVDTFSRAGHFDRAIGAIEKVPDSDLWLTACRKWINMELVRWTFEHALQLDDKCAAAYVCMSSIYAAAGMQQEADKVEALRTQNGAWKVPGRSWWTDIGGNVHSFSVGDKSHLKSISTYAKLEDIGKKLRVEGHSPYLHLLSQATSDDRRQDV